MKNNAGRFRAKSQGRINAHRLSIWTIGHELIVQFSDSATTVLYTLSHGKFLSRQSRLVGGRHERNSSMNIIYRVGLIFFFATSALSFLFLFFLLKITRISRSSKREGWPWFWEDERSILKIYDFRESSLLNTRKKKSCFKLSIQLCEILAVLRTSQRKV